MEGPRETIIRCARTRGGTAIGVFDTRGRPVAAEWVAVSHVPASESPEHATSAGFCVYGVGDSGRVETYTQHGTLEDALRQVESDFGLMAEEMAESSWPLAEDWEEPLDMVGVLNSAQPA